MTEPAVRTKLAASSMSSTPNDLFRHYLDALLQRGAMRAALTEEARDVLRTWYIAAKRGERKECRTSLVSPSSGTGKELPDTPPSTTEPAADIRLPEGEVTVKLQYLKELAQSWPAAKQLHTLRDTMVFATGNPHASIMLIGEAPGYFEEVQQEPFVGKAGEKLNQILTAMGLSREQVYISNIVKFRPAMPNQRTNNRAPSPEEIKACLPIIMHEIQVIRPSMIIALGGTAAVGLLGEQGSVSSMRGRFHELQGIPVRVTYHPSYLLRSESPKEKRKVWEDMLAVMGHLKMPVSDQQRGYFLPKT